MFFSLAIISMLAYAIHGVLLVKHVRNIDSLSVAIYRNLSLTITMLPVFFFIDMADLRELPSVLPTLIYAGVTGAATMVCSFISYQSLPIGVSNSISRISVLLIILWSYLFLNEVVSVPSMILIGVILIALVPLSLGNHSMPHLTTERKKGIIFTLISAFFGSLTIYFMSAAAREVNPLMVGYFWEVLIGVSVLAFGVIRYVLTKKPIQKISHSTLIKITAIASLTLIGTGGYALAVQYGPVAIVSAIGSSSIIVTTILSTFLHHEKLRMIDWMCILVVVGGIVGLGFVQ